MCFWHALDVAASMLEQLAQVKDYVQRSMATGWM